MNNHVHIFDSSPSNRHYRPDGFPPSSRNDGSGLHVTDSAADKIAWSVLRASLHRSICTPLTERHKSTPTSFVAAQAPDQSGAGFERSMQRLAIIAERDIAKAKFLPPPPPGG
jgi:hypothetical protein